jgi:hypothetical protein
VAIDTGEAMLSKRQEKIRLLARTNRVAVTAPSFLAGLSEALGEPVEVNALLPPSDTDFLMETFRSGYQGAIKADALSYRRFFLPDERRLVLRLADCLADQLPAEDVFLLTKMNHDCQAVNVSLSSLLKHTASILRFDGDSVAALSKDYTQGVLIDHNPDDREEAYEVTVWGDCWPLLVLADDRRQSSI